MRPRPDEHSALELIAARLRAAEPHLAAMFSIFTRLTAEEGSPPDEDWIGPARPAGRRRRPARSAAAASSAAASSAAESSAAAQAEPGTPMRVFVIPAVLMLMLFLIVAIATSGGKCAPIDRASVFAYHTAAVTACDQADVAKATGSSR
jgi:hypothetical protein